jgi:hypothetical protein
VLDILLVNGTLEVGLPTFDHKENFVVRRVCRCLQRPSFARCPGSKLPRSEPMTVGSGKAAGKPPQPFVRRLGWLHSHQSGSSQTQFGVATRLSYTRSRSFPGQVVAASAYLARCAVSAVPHARYTPATTACVVTGFCFGRARESYITVAMHRHLPRIDGAQRLANPCSVKVVVSS